MIKLILTTKKPNNVIFLGSNNLELKYKYEKINPLNLYLLRGIYPKLRSRLKFLVNNPFFAKRFLFNTYEYNLEENQKNLLVIVESSDSDPVWVSRDAAMCGVKTYTLSQRLEFDLERFTDSFGYHIWKVTSQSRLNFSDLNSNIKTDISSSLIKVLNSEYFSIPKVKIVHGNLITSDQGIYFPKKSNPKLFMVNNEAPFNEKTYKYIGAVQNLPIIEKAIYLGSSQSWYHFLIDCATLIFSFPEDIINRIPIVIEKNLPFQIKEVCELLTGVPPIEVGIFEEVHVKNLLVPAKFSEVMDLDFSKNELEIKLLAKMIRNKVSPIKYENSERIFINRLNGLFRPMQNKRRIIKILLKENFVTVELEKLTISRQVALINQARVIIVESGAAMTNLIFANEGTSVLELNPGDGGIGFWEQLSRIFSLKHDSIVGKRRFLGREGISSDGFVIPIKIFKSKLKKIGIIKLS